MTIHFSGAFCCYNEKTKGFKIPLADIALGALAVALTIIGILAICKIGSFSQLSWSHDLSYAAWGGVGLIVIAKTIHLAIRCRKKSAPARPKRPSQYAAVTPQTPQASSSTRKIPQSSPALHSNGSTVDRTISTFSTPHRAFINETTLISAMPIQSIPESNRIVLCNHLFDIDELTDYILSKNGNFIFPYSNTLLPIHKIQKIFKFKEHAEKIVSFYRQLLAAQPPIPKGMGPILENLALTLVQDFDASNSYKDSQLAVAHFDEYLETLSPAEREALFSTLVIKKARGAQMISLVSFKSLMDELKAGEICNHQTAVYFWALAAKIDPAIGKDIPQSIVREANFGDGNLLTAYTIPASRNIESQDDVLTFLRNLYSAYKFVSLIQ